MVSDVMCDEDEVGMKDERRAERLNDRSNMFLDGHPFVLSS
jgi:hypothetical protein